MKVPLPIPQLSNSSPCLMIYISAKVSLLFLSPKGFSPPPSPCSAINCSRHHDWHLSKGTSPPYPSWAKQPSWAKPPFLSPPPAKQLIFPGVMFETSAKVPQRAEQLIPIGAMIDISAKKSVEQCSPYDCGLLERQEATYWQKNAGNCWKTQENAEIHLNIYQNLGRRSGGVLYEGCPVVWPTGAVGFGYWIGSSLVNEYAAENDRGRLALVASLPNNTYSARKHLQWWYFLTFFIGNTQKMHGNWGIVGEELWLHCRKTLTVPENNINEE